MADPSPYSPSYSFVNWQSINPAKPLPAGQVDNELSNIATSTSQLTEALKDIRRSDGKLKNRVVTFESLADELRVPYTGGAISAWAPVIPFAAGIVTSPYAPATVVTYAGETYVAKVAVTTTATFNPAEWTKIAAKGDVGPGSGDMLAANNLSDLTNKPQALANIGGASLTALAAGTVTATPTDNTVSTAKIANSAVTQAKLASDIVSGWSAKSSMADADQFLIGDSAASNVAKKITLANVIASIFTTARTIANAQFASATFKLFNSAGTPRALTFNTTALTADRVFTFGDGDFNTNGISIAQQAEQTVSGTSFNLSTSLPASIKRLSIKLNGVTTSATAQLATRLGSSAGFATTGYSSVAGNMNNSTNQAAGSTTYALLSGASVGTGPYSGIITFERMAPGSNVWVYSGTLTITAAIVCYVAGSVTLPGELDRIQLVTLAGTATLGGAASLEWEF